MLGHTQNLEKAKILCSHVCHIFGSYRRKLVKLKYFSFRIGNNKGIYARLFTNIFQCRDKL